MKTMVQKMGHANVRARTGDGFDGWPEAAPFEGIVVTASPGKIERVKSLGAHHVIDYQNQDFAREIQEFTRNRGVQVILDHIGAAYLERNLASLSIGGRLVIISFLLLMAARRLNRGDQRMSTNAQIRTPTVFHCRRQYER